MSRLFQIDSAQNKILCTEAVFNQNVAENSIALRNTAGSCNIELRFSINVDSVVMILTEANNNNNNTTSLLLLLMIVIIYL